MLFNAINPLPCFKHVSAEVFNCCTCRQVFTLELTFIPMLSCNKTFPLEFYVCTAFSPHNGAVSRTHMQWDAITTGGSLCVKTSISISLCSCTLFRQVCYWRSGTQKKWLVRRQLEGSWPEIHTWLRINVFIAVCVWVCMCVHWYASIFFCIPSEWEHSLSICFVSSVLGLGSVSFSSSLCSPLCDAITIINALA